MEPLQQQPDRVFDLAKQFVPYGFGSLWWGRDDLIHAAHPEFTMRENRIGHPLVSVKRGDLLGRSDAIPMLMGTSGKNLRRMVRAACVKVKGLTADDPDHISYFGSLFEPGLYGFDRLLDGVVRKANAFKKPAKHVKNSKIAASKPVPWYEMRTMHPNEYKPHVNEEERLKLEEFCEKHNI